MFLHISDNRSGETLLVRRCGPRETLCERTALSRYLAHSGVRPAPSDGHIPSGCGEIRVEYRPRRDDGLCIWSGADFFLEADD